MRRFTVAVILGLMLFAVGCSKASTACEGPANAVTVCVNGKAVDFSSLKNRPHWHETGAMYAPVEVLGRALGASVGVVLSSDGKTAVVSLNGTAFEPAMADGAKGIHVHDGEVFVPVKELAQALGLQVDLNVEKGTAGFAK